MFHAPQHLCKRTTAPSINCHPSFVEMQKCMADVGTPGSWAWRGRAFFVCTYGHMIRSVRGCRDGRLLFAVHNSHQGKCGGGGGGGGG